jgi:hypothetical protein
MRPPLENPNVAHTDLDLPAQGFGEGRGPMRRSRRASEEVLKRLERRARGPGRRR